MLNVKQTYLQKPIDSVAVDAYSSPQATRTPHQALFNNSTETILNFHSRPWRQGLTWKSQGVIRNDVQIGSLPGRDKYAALNESYKPHRIGGLLHLISRRSGFCEIQRSSRKEAARRSCKKQKSIDMNEIEYQEPGSGGALFAWIFASVIAWSALAARLITLS